MTFFTDITENLSKQSKIQDLLYEISKEFVNIKTEDIEYAIADSLEKMGNAI